MPRPVPVSTAPSTSLMIACTTGSGKPSFDAIHERPPSSERRTPPPRVPASNRPVGRAARAYTGQSLVATCDQPAATLPIHTPSLSVAASNRSPARGRRRNTVPTGPTTAGTQTPGAAQTAIPSAVPATSVPAVSRTAKTSVPSGPRRVQLRPSSTDRSTPATPAAASTVRPSPGANALTFAPTSGVPTGDQRVATSLDREMPRPHVPASSVPPAVTNRAKNRGGPPAPAGPEATEVRSTTGVSIIGAPFPDATQPRRYSVCSILITQPKPLRNGHPTPLCGGGGQR